MAPCAYQQWLRAHDVENGFVLQSGNRLHNITASFPRPEKQDPSLIFFIGRQLKAKALRALFPGNTISHCRTFGIANICAHATTITNDNPMLIADSCPDYTQVKLLRRGRDICHKTVDYPVDNDNGRLKLHNLIDLVLTRLLSLFIDVLCIFAQDCGDLDNVVERLATWTARGSASSLPSTVRPRLLIVTSIPGDAFESEALRFRLRVLSDPKFSDSFSSLNVVNILGTARPSREVFSALGNVL